jgi:hypothetical protein
MVEQVDERPKREALRVARHIRRAEHCLAERNAAGLSPLRRVVRTLLRRELARYRSAARFPQNRDFAGPTPHFVDANGNRCAVAHLLELSGEAALVRRIASERNHARVLELANEPRLVAWLDAAGLTLNEAARIQPSYCNREQTECVCSNRSSTLIEAVTTTTPIDGVASARVEAVHGASSSQFQAGDDVRVSVPPSTPVSTEVMLQPRAQYAKDGTATYSGVTFPYRCGGDAPSLTKEQYMEAMFSSDCERTLWSFDKEWHPVCDEGCDCKVAGFASNAAAPTSLSILVSLVGVIVARRMRC